MGLARIVFFLPFINTNKNQLTDKHLLSYLFRLNTLSWVPHVNSNMVILDFNTLSDHKPALPASQMSHVRVVTLDTPATVLV